LSLKRKVGERIVIAGNIIVQVYRVDRDGAVVLAIDAPRDVTVDREEVAVSKRLYGTKRKD
jgi:carbon storage regulator CsrA